MMTELNRTYNQSNKDVLSVPLGTICSLCKKHKAIMIWTDSTLALTHGLYGYACDCCAIRAQLKHAKEMAKNIPKLQKKLTKLKTSCQ